MSGQFLKRPDSFQTVRTAFKPSGQFSNRLDNMESVQTVLKIIPFEYELICNYSSCLDVIQTNKAKLGFLEWLFVSYAQKLSGRAKTFRVAMLPCYRGFWASGGLEEWCFWWQIWWSTWWITTSGKDWSMYILLISGIHFFISVSFKIFVKRRTKT